MCALSIPHESIHLVAALQFYGVLKYKGSVNLQNPHISQI